MTLEDILFIAPWPAGFVEISANASEDLIKLPAIKSTHILVLSTLYKKKNQQTTL